MIYIDRNDVTAPSILIDPNSKGIKERVKAIKHHTKYPTRKFEYRIYKDAEVKETLVKLFKGKCAYCESSFQHVYSGDVEHFRPKGEIEEANPNKKPGYYWLASDWNNLLLSCRNCNQKLNHQLFGETNKQVMGKMNQFPLSDDTKYCRDHKGDIKEEEKYRLLINPCIDDPEEHLEYSIQGIIKPKKNSSGIISKKGEVSIRVYVLQRVPLVLSREKVMIEIEAQMQRVKEATVNYNKHISSTTESFYFEQILKRELERLKKYLNSEEQYLGMARQLIGEFLMLNFKIKI